MTNIIIIDTGCANLSSVKFAFERLGYKAEISQDLNQIKQADKLLLPGVGTAKAAMLNLDNRNLIDTIKQLTQPVLGICLGMQLLAQFSQEGDVATLGVMSGKTEKLPDKGLPLPHMGWNQVKFAENEPLFSDIPVNSYFYFVHSFAVLPNEHTIATCDYSVPFSAALRKENFYGVQFHPERSGKVGSQLLRNFVENL
ncbi:imidazole glycerol phosphate synthase [Gallibacterium genomosp. 3]|uniref:Imidazole glycerol phosphate synthase subunit HisH n=1 Tax=Gallibacterium genomosp. 3 TaxID=505345 RepID=A0A1A7PQE1_9PAST|nr:imidazole glycerol phosphate synthase subunit HisH [Gallibacterium genomosp. 3]OBX04783.1 imidazole glycerol phosphate synthase [Gallibacterium genomosp. 3]